MDNVDNKLFDVDKIRIEHLYKNMNDILKEIRFVDNAMVVLSGTVWAWIIQYKVYEVISHSILFVPTGLTGLLFLKAYFLLKEYENEKKKYQTILKTTPDSDSERSCYQKILPYLFPIIMIGANFLIAVVLPLKA